MCLRMRLLLCCTCLAILASCVESEHPLSDPMTSKQDPRLYGVWRKAKEDDTVEYVHIGREAYEPLDPNRGQPEPGLMRYWTVKQSDKTHHVENPTGTRFFCTKIAGQDFASWVAEPNPAQHKPRTFFLLKYHVDENQLFVWLQDPEATARAIEAGKLKGVVKRKQRKATTEAAQFDELRITDSTEELIRFLADGGAAACFLDDNKSVYSRIR